MIKFFKIYPASLNLKNLHERQQAFLIYLMAIIPSLEDWNMDVAYQIGKSQIEEMTVKDVKLSESEKDIARLQGADIEQLKKDRLKSVKEQKILELKKQFNIKDKESKATTESGDSVYDELAKRKSNLDVRNIFDMLQGKGLK